MTVDLGNRRLCVWFVGVYRWRDVFAWAWHGRKINPTWSLTLLSVNVELRHAIGTAGGER